MWGRVIERGVVSCSKCGHQVTGAQSEDNNTGRTLSPSTEANSGCGPAAALALVLSCVLLVILALGALGVYQGLRERGRLDRRAELDHYNKGLAYLQQGEYELAIAELESAVRLNPKGTESQHRLEEARAALQGQPTPTSQVRLEAAATYYEEAKVLFEQGRWDEAIGRLETVLVLDPSYRRADIGTMLFESFFNMGVELRDENRLEEAILRWDRALEIRPGDVRVKRERDLASLYLGGTDYWGADWQRAVETFERLYAIDPSYMDTSERLRNAYEHLGDELVREGHWCEAQQRYGQALKIAGTEGTRQKHEEAAQSCSPPEETVPPPKDKPATLVPKGTFVGSIVEYQAIEGHLMIVRGRVSDAQDEAVVGTQVVIGAWNWSAIAVTDGQGIFSFDGLSNPVTYTVALVDLASQPLDVAAEKGKLAWLLFREVQ